MNITELKFSITQLLENTNDTEVLQSIYTILKKLSQEEESIAGYDVEGEPISEDELVASILEASRDSKAGNKIKMNLVKESLDKELF